MPAAPDDAPLEIGAWRGMVRVQGAVRRELDARLQDAAGMSLWDYTVLRTLSGVPQRRMRMTELARATDYTPSGLTRLVGRLERGGLVERTPCPDDGRGWVANLTADGQRAFVRARRTHLAAVQELFLGRCSDDELAMMVGLWERLLPGCTV